MYFIISPLFSFSQSKKDMDFFVIQEDTTFCVSVFLEHVSNKGIWDLTWLNTDGDKTKINNVVAKNVTSLKINTRIYDLLKIPKGGKLIDKYYWRRLDGTIKVYSTDFGEAMDIYQDMPERIPYERYISIRNGPLMLLRKDDDLRENLLPTLLECEEYQMNFSSEFSYDNLDHIVKLFNFYCN